MIIDAFTRNCNCEIKLLKLKANYNQRGDYFQPELL